MVVALELFHALRLSRLAGGTNTLAFA